MHLSEKTKILHGMYFLLPMKKKKREMIFSLVCHIENNHTVAQYL
jgi:hypothetical protein